MSALTVDGGALRILNVLDEHTREALGSKVARSIGPESVGKHLEKLVGQARHAQVHPRRQRPGVHRRGAQALAQEAGRHAPLHREGMPDPERLP
jgi:hypothetical protein